ncbi:unnamed protein product [Psylliodes chrysocephalus]|uniref:Sushi, von Willebrand factor type A, EGF and pentraxin domain-containing protein 1 n=1 Tax=Psylliodes chrysocephalus TaxID=3402493 RepID=A0A9P0CT36_9CUCU|nr:unnamed protein product [Psylliodes chrysocephala]
MKNSICFFIIIIIITKVISNKSSDDNKRKFGEFLNFGSKKLHKSDKVNLESEIDRPKIDVLGDILKEYIEAIKIFPKLDIVFLIDSSSSIGEHNFKSELKFVKKLLSDVIVDYNHTRVAVVAFSSSNNILKNVDEIGKASKNYSKCSLLTKQLKSIKFKGGDTFTLGALKKAKEIFESSDRNDSKKVLFLITDGYSNGGDPIPVAKELKRDLVTIFTIGIRNGNYKELYDISSTPGEYYSYLLDSFNEFESLARRALHSDLKNGDYVPLGSNAFCNSLCDEGDCCDKKSVCSCGTTTGHYSCVCKPGYYGTGLRDNCFPCVTGTYSDGPNSCLPCPDPFHTTTIPAFGIESCKCKEGYRAVANRECRELKCHKMSAPENGYYVKNKVCPNVIFSACGIRCEVGYTLKGTSVRLCQKNGTWSGKETKCEIKTCGPLEGPKRGKLECFQPDLRRKFKNVTTILPVDTICKFTCNEGYILSGSKERTCLPIARWSGLKTLCKPIKCKKLMLINFGSITPLSCQFGRQDYGKVCKYACNDGFELHGPSERRCSERNGIWDTLEKVTCSDISPPNISCPGNIMADSLPRKKFGHASWDNPIVTDNSNLNITVWTEPAITNISIHKFKIGKTKVQYFAQDAFQNNANCTFEVIIKDSEPPYFENCEDPPIFLSNDPSGANITWEEPHASDNSQNVMLTKSHEFGFFKIGTTPVKYVALDNHNNSNICIINITVEVSKCEPLPDPPNGRSICMNQSYGVRCLITCDEGYSIPVTQVTEKDNDTLFVCNDASPVWYSENGFMFSDCSETQIPIEEQIGDIIISDIKNCSDLQNIETIKNDVILFVNTELCTENCTLSTDFDCKAESLPEINKNISNIVKRETKRNKNWHRVNVKYKLRRKYNKKSKMLSNSQIKLKSGYKASINYETKIICPLGSVQRKKKCVYCPRGTFHNETRNICQSCQFGKYNNIIGQTSCVQCPIHYSTRKLRSKKLADCKEQCPPGTHARKRIQKVFKRFHNTTIEKTTLKPHCYSCGIGFYQPNFGELKCLLCPQGYTTNTIGSTSIEQCIPTSKELCRRNVCINGICTTINDYEYTCNCYDRYIGSHCEQQINFCQSQPCYNDGICLYTYHEYICSCKEGYAGKFCEEIIEKQTLTCLNNGITYFEDNGTTVCVCPSGYTGELCEIKINFCEEMFCENNATCIEEQGRGNCKCSGGFIGTRCQLLPCDYKPCPESKICLNTYKENSTIDSYFCVCPDGFTGENCEERINYCLNSPCLNGGICNNDYTNFTCTCSSLYYGSHCELKRSTKYIFNFEGYTTTNYVKLMPFVKNLTDISVCLWIQTLDDVNYGTIISYATQSHDNAFTLTDYTGLVIYINNQYVVTDVHLNDGLWHHVCVTWSSLNGSYKIFVDAKLTKFGFNLAPESQIQGMGSLILGQDQDIFGGEFSQSESFVGKLTYIDIWSKVLTENDVLKHFIDCEDSLFGDLYAWPVMKKFAQGSLKVEESDFCKSCLSPKTLYNGYIEVIHNTAYYSCYTGFTLNNPKFTEGRQCTKASYWEGYYEPFCKRKYCGYPGSIRNGYITGKRYFFQDKISYICYEGYNMIGNSTIMCNENGQWVTEKPRCIGTQCTAFTKPEESELIIMSDQSYEDYKENKTQFDIGTQIEIICPENYELIGENIITCMENGTWDLTPPKCSAKLKSNKIGCSLEQIPKAPLNGYIDMDSYYEASNSTRNVVEYKCSDGYKLVGDNSTSCILDGYWSEPKISCEPITCGASPKFKNMVREEEQTVKHSYKVGDKILFKCNEGYVKLGNNPFIRCMASSKWSRLQGKCLRKSCGKPSIADDTELEGRSYLFGDTVKITCKSGSVYELVCNKNGIWDGDKDASC